MIDFQVNGIDQATISVSRLASIDTRRLLTTLGNLLRSQTVRHFQEESGPAGKFAPWRPGTVRKRGSGQILTDRGRLRGSIQAYIGSDHVEVGTNVSYGRYHQLGTSKMVARPFVGFTDRDRDEVEKVTNAFVQSFLR